jgi:hypothetical protein
MAPATINLIAAASSKDYVNINYMDFKSVSQVERILVHDVLGNVLAEFGPRGGDLKGISSQILIIKVFDQRNTQFKSYQVIKN